MLRIYLLGNFSATWEGDPLPPFPTQKTRVLLAYLVCNRQRLFSREQLAGMFWGDYPEPRAQRNLSTTLWRLRSTLPEGYLINERNRLGFKADNPHWIDAAAFETLCTSEMPGSEKLANLEEAVQLYRGDFLEGWYDDWVLVEAERLRLLYLQALGGLVAGYQSLGEFTKALAYGAKILQRDPLREDIHRQAMEIYIAWGKREAALNQYQACQQALQTELGLQPAPETQALAAKIHRMRTAPPLPASPVPTHPATLATPLPAAPTPPLPASCLQTGRPIALIGRQAQRETLLTRLDALRDGTGGMIFIEGEPGIGKTRLVEEITTGAEWRGVQVLWGYCRSEPYAPLIDILENGLTPLRLKQISPWVDEASLAAIAQLIPSIREQVSLPDLPQFDPGAALLRLNLALGKVLRSLSDITPHLIILEDLHWIDPSTLAALPELARRAVASQLLILGTARGGEIRDRREVWDSILDLDRRGFLEQISLERFHSDEFQALMDSLLGYRRAPRGLVEMLFEKTQGNPFFAIETLKALTEAEQLVRKEDGTWTLEDPELASLPKAVHNVLITRFAVLSPLERQLLDVAAVIGYTLDYDLWGAVVAATDEDLLKGSSELLRRQFITETTMGYSFTHDLIREVTYEAIPSDRRRQFHHQTGLALESSNPQALDDLAFHFYRGEAWEKACRYGHQAGDRALRIYAAESAVTHFSHALESLDRSQPPKETTTASSHLRKAELLGGRESALGFLGRQEERQADITEWIDLVQEMDDPLTLAYALSRQANYLVDISDHERAFQVAARALEMAETGDDPVLEAQIHAASGAACYTLGDYAQAYQHYRSGRDLYQEGGKTNRVGRMITAMGLACIPLGRYIEARDCSEEALQIYRQTGHKGGQISILVNLGMLYGHAGLYRQALEYFTEGLEISREINSVRDIANLQRELAFLLREIGAYEEAERSLQESLAISREIGWPRKEGLALVTLGDLRYNQGRYEEAIAIHLEAMTLNRKLGLDHFVFRSHLALTRIYLALGGPVYKVLEHARKTMRSALVENVSNDLIYAHANLGQALLVAGRKAEALEHSTEAMTRFEKDGYVEEAEEEIVFYHYRVLTALGREIEAHDTLLHAYNRVTQKALLLGGEEAEQFISRPPLNQAIAAEYAQREGLQPGQRRCQLSSGDEVVWTLDAGTADAEIETQGGKVTLRQARLRRLMEEAADQGIHPTQKDLAAALGVSTRTIRGDLRGE